MSVTVNVKGAFSSDVCVICLSEFSEETGARVTVHEKGLATLLRCCQATGNQQLEEYLLSCPEHVYVHAACRLAFIKKRSTGEADLSGSDHQKIPQKKLRSAEYTFNWKTCCFLCGTPVVSDDRHPVSGEFHSASTLELHSSMLDVCHRRMDQWALEVESRLHTCSDLVAAEAVYHQTCSCLFRTGRQKQDCSQDMNKRGLPPNTAQSETFEEMCRLLENSCDSALFSVCELRLRMIDEHGEDSVYSCKQLKRKLLEQYGEHIFFAEVSGRKDVICLRNMAGYILSDKWYADRKGNTADESRRIIEAAASLIKADIREQKYSTDTYPAPDGMHDLDLQTQWMPPLLFLLMQQLVPNHVQQLSLGNALVQAVRPRSVISPVLFGVGVTMEHTFGSKWLVNELSRLGFSVLYDEVVRFKQSVLQDEVFSQSSLSPYPSSFTQWVGDNVDHNTGTIDGRGSFHGMGVIAISTKTTADREAVRSTAVKRLARRPAKEVTADKGIPILTYVPERNGLASTYFAHQKDLLSKDSRPVSTNLDLLWSTGWLFPDAAHPRSNWSGFMQLVSKGSHSAVSDVALLPIIDLNPSDMHCIYSTLSFVEQQAAKLNVQDACVTFDQPLWLKAVEIVASSSLNVVCRLGGFHMMMSFLGSVGTLMSGSGLSDALELCYGPNAVQHMMAGKHVSRALRGHFLADAAVTVTLLNHVLPVDDEECDTASDDASGSGRLTAAEVKSIKSAYHSAVEGQSGSSDDSASEVLARLSLLMRDLEEKLSAESRTAKLWRLYRNQIQTLKMFIRAERTGDWELHLVAVSHMLNLFATTGHNQYARCARLYLQMMRDLPVSHPWLYNQFSEHGFHAVRRSARYWSGLWTDLVIEQVLMRALKSRGGLTHGRGLTESVRLTWIHSMHRCAEVRNAMVQLTHLMNTSSDQHRELATPRASRDQADVMKLVCWFSERDPFTTAECRLYSLSSGVTASEGDGINCDSAEEVGAKIQQKMDGVGFQEVVLKRKDCIHTLQQLQKGVTVGKKTLFMHTTQLFSRLIALVDRTVDMAPYFQYELTPLPAALFKDSRMRKPDKAALANELMQNAVETEQTVTTVYVLDGGSLLHKVCWPKTGKYSDIIGCYLGYVRKHYGCNVVVVFDGYGSGPSLKDHEHERRSVKAGPSVQVSESKPICSSQHAFLANTENKLQFISLLGSCLIQNGHTVRYAEDDADTYIVSTALEIAQTKPVTVVAEDADILALLVHHVQPTMAEVFMLSVCKARKAMQRKLISIQKVQHDIGTTAQQQLLAVHALTGCDTTSALYGHSKVSAFKNIVRSADTKALTDVLITPDAQREDVVAAGIKLLVKVFGGGPSNSLDSMRYSKYMMKVSSGAVLPEKLPPTERAALYHCLRAHLQAVHWIVLDTTALNPTDWGWKREDGKLVPIPTDLEPAPDDLLKVIRCNCKSSSANQCSSNICTCRKNGLHCIAACGGCRGESCFNAQQVTMREDELELELEDSGTVYVDDDDIQWLLEETCETTE